MDIRLLGTILTNSGAIATLGTVFILALQDRKLAKQISISSALTSID